MPMDLSELMNGLFLLIGILGIMYYLGQALALVDGEFPASWGVVAMVCLALTFYHFTKIVRPDNMQASGGRDKLQMSGGKRIWKY